MKRKKYQTSFRDEEGSVMSLVVIMVLCMMLLTMASATLAKTQWTMAAFSRRTSNSYHLARSGAEKVVDSMNKELAKELPRIMKEASNEAQKEMLEIEGNKDGVTYELGTVTEETDGKYVGRTYDKLYESKLKEMIYEHMVDKFEDLEYAAYSDVKINTPIEIEAKIYNEASGLPADLPEDIKNSINLVSKDDIGTSDSDEDAFLVEVVALAQEGAKTSLTKSRVIGTISLNQLLEDDEELLEEYAWADVDPEILQSAVVSFGDFIIQGKHSAKIDGDVHVKGTKRRLIGSEYIQQEFPEVDEHGGIVISEGGELEVDGNAYVVSNIQTANTYGKEKLGATIKINKDAIANTIAINDNYYAGHYKNKTPWNNPAEKNKITVGRNVYMDNDVRIDRYIKDSHINITGSVFGISDGDREGINIGAKVYVDPNKSSGVFCIGENSTITMGRAFIAGQPFINFRDGMGYHRLHESVGEPFEDVYYLDEYRTEQFGHSNQYIEDFYDMINKEKIVIKEKIDLKPYGYAPARVSAKIGESTNGDIYDIKAGTSPMTKSEAEKIFYQGSANLSGDWEDGLAASSDWKELIHNTEYTWSSVIQNPLDYYGGANPYNKQFFPPGWTETNYTNMLTNMPGYKGLEGYMLAKRGVFYGEFKFVGGTLGHKPAEKVFENLVELTQFTESEWSYNNPIHVVTGSTTIDIDIDKFSEIPTAIICTNPGATLILEAKGSTKKFNGIIINAGKTEIVSEMTINGVIITGNEKQGWDLNREEIQSGEGAGLVISAQGVTIKYDKDQLLKIRCMDKALQRKLFDCLKITQYKDAGDIEDEQERINKIMGPEGKRRIKLSPLSVISSEQGGLQFVLNSLRKLK